MIHHVTCTAPVRWSLCHLGFLSNNNGQTPHSWPAVDTAAWGEINLLSKLLSLRDCFFFFFFKLLHYNLVLACLDWHTLPVSFSPLSTISSMTSVLVSSSGSHIYISITSVLTCFQELSLANSSRALSACLPHVAQRDNWLALEGIKERRHAFQPLPSQIPLCLDLHILLPFYMLYRQQSTHLSFSMSIYSIVIICCA